LFQTTTITTTTRRNHFAKLVSSQTMTQLSCHISNNNYNTTFLCIKKCHFTKWGENQYWHNYTNI